MGISYRDFAAGAVPVRTGAERATLIRRTYLLVFASVLVTMAGTAFAISTPPVLAWAARHPIITFIGSHACASIRNWRTICWNPLFSCGTH